MTCSLGGWIDLGLKTIKVKILLAKNRFTRTFIQGLIKQFILYTAFLATCAASESDPLIKQLAAADKTSVELGLFVLPNISKATETIENSSSTHLKAVKPKQNNLNSENPLTSILLQHYKAQASDPPHVKDDLIELSHYFNQYPETILLITSIQDLGWQLQYKPNIFKTIINGSRLNVESAIIYFDTRSAARLKFNRKCEGKWHFCVASPGDALLHELLHTQSALLSPNQFLKEGGLNGVIYPYIHERKIIQKENKIYQAMTKTDGLHRPIRKNHVGRYLKATCSTCVY